MSRREHSLKWAGGPGLIGAGVAEMDFDPAAEIVEALERAVGEGSLGYPTPVEQAALVRAFLAYLADQHRWTVPTGRCFVFSDVLRVYLALLAYTPRASTVCVLSPSYRPLRELPLAFGHRVAEVPLHRDSTGWAVPFDRLEAAFAEHPGLFVLVNPHNPTGKVFSDTELREIARLSREYSVPVFADEIYEPLVLANVRHIPFGAVADGAEYVAAYSAGKAWNVSGLRCCQIVVSDPGPWRAVEAAIGGGASVLGIAASRAAYTSGLPWLADVRRRLRASTRTTVADLDALMASPVVAPEAGYLVWAEPDFDCGCPPERHFEANGLQVQPGRDFGAGWETWIRLNVATDPADLTEVLERCARSQADSRRPHSRHG